MSPVYQIEMGLVGRLLSQDPDLYGDMLTGNPDLPRVLSACSESLAELSALILARDTDGFRKVFSEDALHFAEYTERAAAETDLLIASMVER
jgi:prephenate dehydrogenase